MFKFSPKLFLKLFFNKLNFRHRLFLDQLLKQFLDKLYWTIFFFSFFWQHHVACDTIASCSGIKPVPPAPKGRILTTGPPGKSQFLSKFSLGSGRETYKGTFSSWPVAGFLQLFLKLVFLFL